MTLPRRRKPGARSAAGRANIRITVSGCNSRIAAALRRAARHALVREAKLRATIEIAVIDDAAMRVAHRRWKNSSAATDVLSFDLSDDPRRIEGVLMVCDDTARREARRRGNSILAELSLYVVHGTLHLAGHDDRKPRDFARMHRREDELLGELGLGRVFAD